VDRPKSQYFFCDIRKKAGSALVHLLIFVERNNRRLAPRCDATPPAEYLIICSD